jgi:hypothetical protein
MLDLITNKTGTANSTGKTKNKKTLQDMLFDSLIISGITFFSVWNGTTLSLEQMLIVLKATGISFFIQLAYERGIKKVK